MFMDYGAVTANNEQDLDLAFLTLEGIFNLYQFALQLIIIHPFLK